MEICVGGTFSPFHVGHEALLRAAAEAGDSVYVGITDGRLASRDRPVPGWEERARPVERFLLRHGVRVEVSNLRSAAGPAVTRDFSAIVVTPETRAGAEAINSKRRAKNKKPLRIIEVPHVLGRDRLPVSATAIHEGRIDRNGRRLRPVQIAVGSQNPVKVDAVGYELAAFLGRQKVQVSGEKVKSGVPEQPKGKETLEGARTRARLAMEETQADYAVGVEAGLMKLPGSTSYVDMQACVVLDRTGHETVGWGPGFHYPEWVEHRAAKGEMVSDILGPVVDDPNIGGTIGAIGYLSEGKLDRMHLTRHAVFMALLPRVRRDLYNGPPA